MINMKSLWLYCVRAYLQIGLFFYFKKIDTYGLERIPKGKPVLLLCNHQNALLDPLLIATRLSDFGYYLTRAGVFQKSFVAKLLESLNMLPVYRIRDGWSNLTNNTSVFERVTELFQEHKIVTIYPEGSHNLARRVRPLSKGFTRVVFDTLEKYPETELVIVPIGVNYKNAETFVDSASMYVGEPINPRNYVTKNRNEAVVALKKEVHKSISELTTHIPEVNYDETLKKLESLSVDFLKPKDVNACIASNYEDCNAKGKSNNSIKVILKWLLIISVLPVYLVWKFVAEPKINEIEFTSTFRFAVAVTLGPIYLILITVILSVVFSLQIALIVVFSILALELLAVKL